MIEALQSLSISARAEWIGARLRHARRLQRLAPSILAVSLAIGLAACSPRVIPSLNILGSHDTKPAVLVPAAQARFAILPVAGVPAETLRKLTEGIREEASKRALVIVPEGDPSASYQIKGYLSAVGGPSGAIMVYVWDILDANGTRLHRISGQEPSTGGVPDPWGGISDATLRLVARRTVDGLRAWVLR